MRTSESVQAWLKYLFPDELEHLKTLARALPPSPVVVNIGAGGGTSGLAFMEARLDMNLVTVDIQDESSPYGCLEAERQMFKEAGFPLPTQTWRQIHGDSKAVRWDDGLVDMVFIDGDHSYEGCKGDILAWKPRLKPGGILAIHDFEKFEVFKGQPIEGAPHFKNWPGVDRAVAEMVAHNNFHSWYTIKTLAVLHTHANWRKGER